VEKVFQQALNEQEYKRNARRDNAAADLPKPLKIQRFQSEAELANTRGG
jgi:hypothetical protein